MDSDKMKSEEMDTENKEFSKPADLILQNARVWTVDERIPTAEAVSIRGNAILDVGRNEQMRQWIGPQTEVLDLDDKLVLPGFNDSHTHFIFSMLGEDGKLDLYGIDTLEEVQNHLAAFARENPKLDWLLGLRWRPSQFGEKGWPDRRDLDAVESQRPVAIRDIDGHSCWVNTAALSKLGYGAGTADPPGGQILRDEHGEPTGILLENAHEPVPTGEQPTLDEFAAITRRRIRGLNKLGVTSLSNNGIQEPQLERLAEMAAKRDLNLRIYEWPFIADGLDRAKELQRRYSGNEIVRVGGLKALIDGVQSARTAWMLEPYADAPDQAGFPCLDVEWLAGQILEADRQGFQVIIHAIGDKGVRTVLDMYEEAIRVNGPRDRRFRIEHAEVVHPEDQKRFARLNVIAAMMPMHCTADVDRYIKTRMGEWRAERLFAWRRLVDLGAHLAFGTDWPVIDLTAPDPLKQIYAAATRTHPPSGSPAWHPEMCLSVEQAVRSYTLECAYAEFSDDRKGSITPGKLADLCVLSDNIFQPPFERILETEVVMTVFDGRVVYQV